MAWPSFGGTAITSPEQAARQRQIAQALIGQSATPGNNWAEGLGDIAAALSGTVLEGRVSEAEAAGRERAGGLFADLALTSSPDAIAAALMSPDAAWASDAQTDIASALLNQGMERSDPLYQLRLQQAQLDYDQDMAGPVTGGGEYGLTPIWGQMPDGTFAYGVQGKDGTFRPVDTGELTPLDPRTLAGERAAGTVTGKTEAEMAIAAPGDIAQADTALDYIRQIETHPEKPWATGFSAGMGGNAVPGTGRFGFQNLVDQAKSGAFLTAIDEMRGLGALSNTEGGAATQAITRLNTALSEADFDKALADYKAIVERGRDRARRRVRVDENGNEMPADGGQPAQDGWQDVGGGVRIRPMAAP